MAIRIPLAVAQEPPHQHQQQVQPRQLISSHLVLLRYLLACLLGSLLYDVVGGSASSLINLVVMSRLARSLARSLAWISLMVVSPIRIASELLSS